MATLFTDFLLYLHDNQQIHFANAHSAFKFAALKFFLLQQNRKP